MKSRLLGVACACLLVTAAGAVNAATINYEWYYTGINQMIAGTSTTISVSANTAEGASLGQHTTSAWNASHTSIPVGASTYQWATGDETILQQGGPMTVTVSFSSLIQANQLMVMVGNLASGFADVTLSGGSASTADFFIVNEDFGAAQPSYTYNSLSGNINRTGGAHNHGYGFIIGNSSNLVDQLTFSVDGTDAGDYTLLGVAVASPVPVPAAVWLFSSGLLGLIGMARRKKAA